MGLFRNWARFRLDDEVRRRGRAAFIRGAGVRFGLTLAVAKSAIDVWTGPPASAANDEWTWLAFRVTLHLLGGLAAGYFYARTMWALSERDEA